MSDLPDGWVMLPLGDISTRTKNIDPSKYPDELFELYSVPSFFAGGAEYLKGAEIGSIKQIVEPDDILLCKIVPHINRVWVVPDCGLHRQIGSGEWIVYRHHFCNPGYLRHCLTEGGFREKFLETSSGVGGSLTRARPEAVSRIEIPVAPRNEQNRIVAKIERLTARTARARTELDRIPTLIARYKQRLLALAFSGELTAAWRENDGEKPDSGATILRTVGQLRQKIRLERGLRNAGRNRSLSVQSPDLPDLPGSWGWSTFNDCAWDLTVGHVGPMKERYVEEGIPFLRSLNVRENFVDLRNVVYIDEKFHGELKKSEIHAGELIVVRTGAPGTAAVVPESLGRANCSDLVIARLVPAVNPHYAAYYMNSEFAKSAVRGMQVGVAQQHFNVGAMSEMPIPIAPEHEQTEIVRRIESAFNWMDRMAADHAAASKLVPKLDAAILAKAFRGELVPQDPTDEPASALLERIKMQPAEAPAKGRRKRTETATMASELKPDLLTDSLNWPADGLAFDAISRRLSLPYEQLKQALFAALGGEEPELVQAFDAESRTMRLRRAKP